MKTLASWRVVYMTECHVECKTRKAARLLAKQTQGKVQGYIPAVGWLDDSRIPEGKEERQDNDS